MKTLVFSALVFALAATASPVIEETRHQQELREHYHHLSYIAEYSCHHPQPRTVPVHELLSPYQTRGKAYFPEYTVLHRCDVFAGCCEGAKKCGPLHADNVHLPFKVTYLEDMGDKHKGEWEMEYGYFDNHTVCGCIDHHGLYKPEVHYEEHGHNDHYEHEEHEHNDHYALEDHDHKIHHKEDNDHKDHYKHDDHEHKDLYAFEDHDHKDHYAHEDHKPQYAYVIYKDQYQAPPPAKDQYRPDDSSLEKSEKSPEKKDDNAKIESLYIKI